MVREEASEMGSLSMAYTYIISQNIFIDILCLTVSLSCSFPCKLQNISAELSLFVQKTILKSILLTIFMCHHSADIDIGQKHF